MLWEIGTIAKTVLLPPLLWGWLVLFGLVMFKRRPRAARLAIAGGLFLGYLSATPLVAGSLMYLVADGRKAADGLRPQAIVVLAGGRTLQFDDAGRVISAGLGPSTSERVLEGIRLARLSKLPILVTSGKPDGRDPAEAIVMRDVMTRDLSFPPKWVEDESRNTVENARNSSRLLAAQKIDTIVLVTHAYHMRRARFLFEAQGLRVVPAPVNLPRAPVLQWPATLRSLVPDAGSLGNTFLACNEVGGIAYAWLVTQLAAAPTAAATPSAAVGN